MVDRTPAADNCRPFRGLALDRAELGEWASQMKISYLVYEPVASRAELAERMEYVAALGYQGIELVATNPLAFGIDEARELAERYRLPIVSLLSGWSYANEHLCLSSPDAGVRDRAVERLVQYVGYAGRLRSVLVVGLMQGLRSDEPDEALALERIAGCLRRVAQAAAEQSVSMVIEPVNHQQVGFNHTAAEAAAMAERVGSPALSYMLDTIHMHIEERDPLDTIRRHGRHVRHFHLCESNGGPFGGGNLDFPAVLAAIDQSGYDRFVSVKIYRRLGWRDAARSAAEFLRARGVLR